MVYFIFLIIFIVTMMFKESLILQIHILFVHPIVSENDYALMQRDVVDALGVWMESIEPLNILQYGILTINIWWIVHTFHHWKL